MRKATQHNVMVAWSALAAKGWPSDRWLQLLPRTPPHAFLLREYEGKDIVQDPLGMGKVHPMRRLFVELDLSLLCKLRYEMGSSFGRIA